MQQTGTFEATGKAEAAHLVGLGHPALVRFDQVRNLLVQTGLAPEPETYEILYLYVGDADRSLSREIERTLETGRLDLTTIRNLRTTYLGDIAAAELMELVKAAHDSATELIDDLGEGRNRLSLYDATLKAEEESLSKQLTVGELLALVQRLRQANQEMMTANIRLEAEITEVTEETARLLDRLETSERAASTDPLTGLPNKHGLMGMLKRAQLAAAADDMPLSVGLVDIDHFAGINRQWGLDIGDEVLRCVGAHLRKMAQDSSGEKAFVGRYASDQFAVVLPALDLKQSVATVEAARALLARQMLRRTDDGTSLGRISFSAGVAQHRTGDTAEGLVDRADAALFRAKNLGRDRVLPEKNPPA